MKKNKIIPICLLMFVCSSLFIWYKSGNATHPIHMQMDGLLVNYQTWEVSDKVHITFDGSLTRKFNLFERELYYKGDYSLSFDKQSDGTKTYHDYECHFPQKVFGSSKETIGTIFKWISSKQGNSTFDNLGYLYIRNGTFNNIVILSPLMPNETDKTADIPCYHVIVAPATTLEEARTVYDSFYSESP